MWAFFRKETFTARPVLVSPTHVCKGGDHDLRVVCSSTALRRLNEQEWMLPCNSPSKSSIEKWYRQLLKMPIGYVGYVGYNNKLPYMGE